jgi:hypothetical protein
MYEMTKGGVVGEKHRGREYKKSWVCSGNEQ